jgi:hypothetical protein
VSGLDSAAMAESAESLSVRYDSSPCGWLAGAYTTTILISEGFILSCPTDWRLVRRLATKAARTNISELLLSPDVRSLDAKLVGKPDELTRLKLFYHPSTNHTIREI